MVDANCKMFMGHHKSSDRLHAATIHLVRFQLRNYFLSHR